MSESPLLSISIVSHLQGELIRPLLLQLASWRGCQVELLLTLNLPEDEGFIDAAAGLGGDNQSVAKADVAMSGDDE